MWLRRYLPQFAATNRYRSVKFYAKLAGMGTITPYKGKRRTSYRAEVCVGLKRRSKTLATRAEAAAWIRNTEAELDGDALPENTVKQALDRYAREVSPGHKGARWELLRLSAVGRQPIGAVRLPALRGSDLADWREARLGQVAPGSVLREMTLLHSVFESCRRDWGWLKANPLKEVRRPTAPASRKRRITPEEVDAILAGLGYKRGKPVTLSHRVAIAFLFALETAMRSGEIVGLQWADVGPHSVRLPRTKNGDSREVALSKKAVRLLALLPRGKGPVFGLSASQRDALFRKGRERSGVSGMTFHDSRAEAIWRLSKKLDVMELARMIGHRDLKSLLLYYSTSAAELSAKLG